MPRNANAPGEGGDAGETAMGCRLSRVDHTPSAPTAASRLPFTPDADESYCPRCQRLVIRRGHRSRCLARKAAP